MFFGKIYIRFCSNPALHIRMKALMFFLYVSLVIVELMLDIGLVIVLEGTKTLGVVRCFVTCVDLPKRKKTDFFF